MPEPSERDPEAPPRALRWAVVVVIVLVGGRMATHAYISDAARGCGRLYRAAHTAADSARVDTTVPSARDGEGTETHTCGHLRSTARWF